MTPSRSGPGIRAVKFKNLDEARRVVAAHGREEIGEFFDDDGREPQGLLAVICEGQVSDEVFYGLFGQEKGALIEVEEVYYSGYGPPAEEEDYIGYTSTQTAYVVLGQGFQVGIEGCPSGAKDIYQLEALVLDGQHPLDRRLLDNQLALPDGWDFDDLFEMIYRDEVSANQIDQLLHSGKR